jgi:NADH-quinone oxidoreductase subunit L
MTWPLIILAVFAALLGFVGTPAWPWFQNFLEGRTAPFAFGNFTGSGIVPLMIASTIIVFAGLALGWWLYGRKPIRRADEPDALERLQPGIFHALADRLYVDQFYALTVIRFAHWISRVFNWMDRWIWNGIVQSIAWIATGIARIDSLFDARVINTGFDEGCEGFVQGGRLMSRLQSGRVQNYLRVLGLALIVFVLFLFWSHKG